MMVRRGSLIGALLGLALLPASAPAQGSATVLAAGDVDYLDPGQTYYTFGFMVQFAVNRPLYSFVPGKTEPVPDLAAGPPQISADNRQITVPIRAGVRYAPPVNREVVARDVEYAIERALSANVASGYASVYFGALEGAPSRPGRIRDISGISAPDPRTLVLRLRRPVAQQVAAALVMPITVPVPPEVARPYDRRKPSTYDRGHVAYTGPYMVARRRPGRSIRLVRNPNWDRATDFRPAYLDSIAIDEGERNLVRASQRALAGSRMLCCDAGQPPIPVLRRALRDRPAQVGRIAGGGTRWIAMNARVKPFHKPDVRRGVVAGLNRERLRLTRGGPEVGPIAQHFLPPGIPGHEQTGVADLDFLQHPGGNRALARQYFQRAKLRRTRRPLLMVGTREQPGRNLAREAARQFRRLGFRIRLKLVPQDRLYTNWCGVRGRRYAICANVGWFKDFQDPQSMLEPTFRHLPRRGNVNWSQLRVPSLFHAMDAASTLPAGPDRWAAWAAINRDITALAPGVPIVWDDSFQLVSADLDAPMNPYSTTADLSFIRPR